MADIGHNSAAQELRGFADRLKRLKDEKKEKVAEFNEDIKQVRAEAKGRGYDLKALDEAARRLAMDENLREIADLYESQLSVFD